MVTCAANLRGTLASSTVRGILGTGLCPCEALGHGSGFSQAAKRVQFGCNSGSIFDTKLDTKPDEQVAIGNLWLFISTLVDQLSHAV